MCQPEYKEKGDSWRQWEGFQVEMGSMIGAVLVVEWVWEWEALGSEDAVREP